MTFWSSPVQAWPSSALHALNEGAMAEVRRRCAYLDYRFSLLKNFLPNILCAVLVEAPKEDQTRVLEVVTRILGKWNLVTTTLTALRAGLAKLVVT